MSTVTDATVLIVKYRGGFVEVAGPNVATNGRREAYVSIDTGNREQAVTIATTILTVDAAATYQASLEVQPRRDVLATVPGLGPKLGQFLGAPTASMNGTAFQRMVGMTLAVDGAGRVTFVPELGSILDEREARLQRWIRRLLLGGLGGDSEASSPTHPRVGTSRKHTPDTFTIPFSLPGPADVSSSPRWYAKRDGRATKVTASLDTEGTSSTTVTVAYGIDPAAPTVFATLTLAAGVNKVETVVAQVLEPNHYVVGAVTVAGAGAEDLTIQVDATDESAPPPD